mgnify:CR=1 FL=1
MEACFWHSSLGWQGWDNLPSWSQNSFGFPCRFVFAGHPTFGCGWNWAKSRHERWAGVGWDGSNCNMFSHILIAWRYESCMALHGALGRCIARPVEAQPSRSGIVHGRSQRARKPQITQPKHSSTSVPRQTPLGKCPCHCLATASRWLNYHCCYCCCCHYWCCCRSLHRWLP